MNIEDLISGTDYYMNGPLLGSKELGFIGVIEKRNGRLAIDLNNNYLPTNTSVLKVRSHYEKIIKLICNKDSAVFLLDGVHYLCIDPGTEEKKVYEIGQHLSLTISIDRSNTIVFASNRGIPLKISNITTKMEKRMLERNKTRSTNKKKHVW